MKPLRDRTRQFRDGLDSAGFESIPGPHPVVPLLVRDTDRTRAMVQGLYERGVLAVGLTFPVVPRGDETIRLQHERAPVDHFADEQERKYDHKACRDRSCEPASACR